VSRTVLVTGAARGIGAAIAGRLEADGWSVHAVDVEDGDLATRDGNRAVVDAALARFDGRLDAVVANAGFQHVAPVPFHLLPRVVREVGSDVEVWLDTGIMSGADVVAAVAHGATFTLIGRAYLYGLMAGGRPGVDRSIEILTGQIERTMRLLGVGSLSELTPEHVTQLRRLVPMA
jgi:isopentenyl diphosphate isomerase/L-lactate dehydrogenase-like FMN-dependent dehydrogenase